MRALLHDPDNADPVLGETADVTPADSEVLIAVETIGLNRLDVAYRHERMSAGQVPGVDAAGRVVTAARDGSGPPAGARVVSFASGGAWAERRAVATGDVAVVPDSVDLGAAVALPGAGVTALQVVRDMGALDGARLLVTGASGGVGRFAVQLASLAGAQVIAAVGRPERGAGLAELGATEVVTDLDGVAPVDRVLDTVGGDLLATAFSLLATDGRLWSVGRASGRPTVFDLEEERNTGRTNRWLTPFAVQLPFGPDLVELLDLVADGSLSPCIGWRGPWTDIGVAAEAMRRREVLGKAVLDVSG